MFRAIMISLLLFDMFQSPCAASPHMEKRIALVIGNSSYASAPRLQNPARDANIFAAALQKIRFTAVKTAIDLNRDQLLQALQDFATQAETADWAVIYYAGHGIEISGTNYLVPIDARLRDDRAVQFEAVALPQVLAAVEGARGLRLVILDACRDNPFVAQMKRSATSRSIGRGLARIEPEGGILVAYAAKEKEVAFDGDGENSPFVTSLIKQVTTPGLEINRVFRRVRSEVLAATHGRQEPFVYGSLPDEDFYFDLSPAGRQPEMLKPVEQSANSQASAPLPAVPAEAREQEPHSGRVTALEPPQAPIPNEGSSSVKNIPALLEVEVGGGGMAYWGGKYDVNVVDKLGSSLDRYKCELKFDSSRAPGKDFVIEGNRCSNTAVKIMKGSSQGSMPFTVEIERPGGQRTVLKSAFWNMGQASVQKEIIYSSRDGGPMHLGGTVKVRILPLQGSSLDTPDDQTCRWQTSTDQIVQFVSKNGCEVTFAIRANSYFWSVVQKEGFKEQYAWVNVLGKNGVRLGFTEVKYSVVP